MNRRLGKFKVNESFVFDCDEAMFDLMSNCIIYRAEHLGYEGVFEYVAYSENFREVPMGEIIPTYSVKMSKAGVTFEEI